MTGATGDIEWELAFAACRQVESAISSVVQGQEDQIRTIVATVLARGHILLEDRPGVGKTTLARALGSALGQPMNRIQGTADLLPTDITGVHVFQPNTGEWKFRPGPILSSVVLVDELNRATPKAQSALLEAMAEGQVTVDGDTFELPETFLVIATQNPPGEPGTYPLVPAQLDRFAVSLSLGLPEAGVERRMLEDRVDTIWPEPLEVKKMAAAVRAADAVEVLPQLLDYIMALVVRARDHSEDIWLSVRVPRVILTVARALAIVDQRSFLTPDDVQAAFLATVGHRLPHHVDAEALTNEVLAAVPVPLGT